MASMAMSLSSGSLVEDTHSRISSIVWADRGEMLLIAFKADSTRSGSQVLPIS